MAKANTNIKGVTQKNGYWYARIDGSLKYCGKGDKGFNMAKAARQKWEVKQYENREVGAGLRVKKIQLKNVINLSNWYMTLPSIQDQKSYNRKIHAVKPLVEYFGNKPLNNIEVTEQERYRQHRAGQGIASGTIDLELKFLRSMYLKAMRSKLIPVDFLPGEFVFIDAANPRKIITDDEYTALLKHAKDDFKDVLICAYETGMRVSEICNLTAGQVKLDIQHFSGAILDYIDLGIFDTKTKARRTIPVSDIPKVILEHCIKGRDPDDSVFITEKGYKFTPSTITMRMMTVCNNAGIVYGDKPVNAKGERIGIVFHCFRHTRTSKWIKKGFSDEIVRRATGHRSLSAFQQYVKLDPFTIMKLVEKPKRDKNGIKSLQTL